MCRSTDLEVSTTAVVATQPPWTPAPKRLRQHSNCVSMQRDIVVPAVAAIRGFYAMTIAMR